jgi:hypothetical protein
MHSGEIRSIGSVISSSVARTLEATGESRRRPDVRPRDRVGETARKIEIHDIGPNQIANLQPEVRTRLAKRDLLNILMKVTFDACTRFIVAQEATAVRPPSSGL